MSTNEDHDRRLHAVEQTLAEVRVRSAELEAIVETTAKRVDDVKRDTEEIVSLIKGANVLARVMKWLTVVIGGYLAGKGLKWW